jgi:hypothetical protein
VHDEADVRAIDSHPERDRGDDDVHLLVEEPLLVPAAHLVGQSRMVRHRAMPFFMKPVGQRLDFAPRLAVQDAGFALVSRQDVCELPLQVAAPQHAIGQVRPIERSDEHRRLPQPQLRDDVPSHALRGGRREGVKRYLGKILAQPSQLPVLGPEVVAPLADAVGLVDRDEAHAGLLQHPPQRLAPFADDPFRRHVEQTAALLADAGQHLVPLVRQERAVQVGRRDAVDAQAVDLILHQRNQRRHDEGDTSRSATAFALHRGSSVGAFDGARWL